MFLLRTGKSSEAEHFLLGDTAFLLVTGRAAGACCPFAHADRTPGGPFRRWSLHALARNGALHVLTRTHARTCSQVSREDEIWNNIPRDRRGVDDEADAVGGPADDDGATDIGAPIDDPADPEVSR